MGAKSQPPWKVRTRTLERHTPTCTPQVVCTRKRVVCVGGVLQWSTRDRAPVTRYNHVITSTSVTHMHDVERLQSDSIPSHHTD